MDKDELIVKYYRGTLTKSERLEFDSLMQTNEGFKTEVNDYQDIQQAFKLNEREDLKTFLNRIDKKNTLKRPFSTLFTKSKLTLIATAACLILAFFYFLNNTQSNEELYASFFEEYPNVLQPIIRGADENINYNAFRAYENKDYRNAELAFENLIKIDKNPNLEFYYAMTLLNQNNFDKAKKVLNSLKAKKQDFLAETYWYCALIALKNNDLKLTRKELEKLHEVDSTFKKEKREALLKRIN